MITLINKPLGWTPLQALEKYRELNPKYQNSKITYAGRLDPMAEGVLLLLIDGDQNDRESTLALGKEYQFEVLFGFSTDTYDLLGLVQAIKPDINQNIINQIDIIKDKYIGKIEQTYPPFSSKVVNGKPLWLWAKEGQIHKIELPTHEIFIEKISLGASKLINTAELLNEIETKLSRVTGDFRQQQIIAKWRRTLNKYNAQQFTLIPINMICSSGTYVRQLVQDIGQDLTIPTVTYSIKRARVGLYNLKDCVELI